MRSFLCGLLGFILGERVLRGQLLPAGDSLFRHCGSGGAVRRAVQGEEILVDALRDYEKKAYDFTNLPYAPKNLAELVDGGLLSERDYQDATTGLQLDYFGSPEEGWGRDGIVVVGHGRGFAVYGSKSGSVAVREIK
jgi:hypothetical protein